MLFFLSFMYRWKINETLDKIWRKREPKLIIWKILVYSSENV